jgi:flagellar protein FlgJ
MKLPSLGEAPAIASRNSVNPIKTAKSFETMVIGAMLTPMFKTIGKADAPFGAGSAEKEFQPFFISAVAKAMEARGGLGLSSEIETVMAEKTGGQK